MQLGSVIDVGFVVEALRRVVVGTERHPLAGDCIADVDADQQDTTSDKPGYHGSHVLNSPLTSCDRRQLKLPLPTVTETIYQFETT